MPVTKNTASTTSAQRAIRGTATLQNESTSDIEDGTVAVAASSAARSDRRSSSVHSESSTSTRTATAPQPRRVTRSATRQGAPLFSQSSDTEEVSGEPSEHRGEKRPAAATGTDEAASTSKKARPSSIETSRTYNLRSTRARQEQQEPSAPAVTPGSMVRHLDFEERSHQSSPSSIASDATVLPDNVVNIYDSKQQSCGTPSLCDCPAEVSLKNDTALAFAHIAHYGREYENILQEKEDREASEWSLVPMPAASSSSSSSSVLGIDDDQDSSRPGTPRHGSILLYQPGVMPRARNSLGGDAVAAHEAPSSNGLLPRQPFLTGRMRGILINWLVEMGQEYNISEDAFHLSVTLLDVILNRGPTPEQLESEYDTIEDDDDDEKETTKPWFLVNKHEFQALGCACTWIAAKIEDRNPPSVEDFTYISDHSFSGEKLRNLEERICREVRFCLHRVTPMHFVNGFLRASNACPSSSCQFDHPVLRQLVMYLLELSRLCYDLSHCKPSLLAAAAVYLARATLGLREKNPEHAVDERGFWTKTLQYHTGYSLTDLKETVLTIHRYQLTSEGSNMKAPFEKYKKTAYGSVSLKTTLRVEDLGFATSSKHDDLDIEEGSHRIIL